MDSEQNQRQVDVETQADVVIQSLDDLRAAIVGTGAEPDTGDQMMLLCVQVWAEQLDVWKTARRKLREGDPSVQVVGPSEDVENWLAPHQPE